MFPSRASLRSQGVRSQACRRKRQEEPVPVSGALQRLEEYVSEVEFLVFWIILIHFASRNSNLPIFLAPKFASLPFSFLFVSLLVLVLSCPSVPHPPSLRPACNPYQHYACWTSSTFLNNFIILSLLLAQNPTQIQSRHLALSSAGQSP